MFGSEHTLKATSCRLPHRLSGIIGIVVAIGTAVGIYEQEYSLLCFTLIASGVFNGCQNPAMVCSPPAKVS